MCLLYQELRSLNPFPSLNIQRNMPFCFHTFPNLRVILECTEIFVQKSSSLLNQNLSFSHYKHHTTVKFFIGITPSGVISLVIEDLRLTDNWKVSTSRHARRRRRGYDRQGFYSCRYASFPFIFYSVFFSRCAKIAKLRIHVERDIGRVKKFHIFDGVLSLSLATLVSQMFSVCCWITNLDVPLVDS